MKNKVVIILSLLLGLFYLSSCESTNNIAKLDNNDVSSIVNMIDLYNTDDVEESTVETKSTEEFEKCFEVIRYPNEGGEVWPITWTVDFGEEGCISHHGTIRTGKIHVTLTDCWRNEGSLRTIIFEDFYVDNNHIEGTKTIENTGLNENSNPTWEWNILDGKVTDEDGVVKTLSVTRYSEMVEGAETWGFFDDIYEVTGAGSGTNDGQAFTVEITTPLRYEFGCMFPVSGIIEIVVENADTIIIDYGDGECDKTVTKRVGNNVEEITLGKA